MAPSKKIILPTIVALEEELDAKLIQAGGIMRTSANMASFSDAVFSHTELANNHGVTGRKCAKEEDGVLGHRPSSKSEAHKNPSTTAASIPSRKRKVASVVSLVSLLDRGSEVASSESAAVSHDPDEMKFLSGCTDDSGMIRLSFPMKLHWMLYEYEMGRQAKKREEEKNKDKRASKKQKISSSETKGDTGAIIGWVSSGTAFMIFDEDRFVKGVMPKYFTGGLKEFKRDLRLWGFTDVPSVRGPPTRMVHFCSHPNFLRDQPSRCRAMKFGMIISKSKSGNKPKPAHG